MDKRIFLAGASGAIGRRLSQLLVADGWQVYGTTRFETKVSALEALGVLPVVVDVYDKDALTTAMVAAQPSVVIHQLTDLPPALDPEQMPAALVRNARLRIEGTRNLIAAAIQVGAQRFIAQSLGFIYAPGNMPFVESDPLMVDDPNYADTVKAVMSLETQTLAAPMTGIVLRYGKLYGPGTGFDIAPEGAPIHVDAAADAARKTVTLGDQGIYNCAEDDGMISSEKAKQQLNWRADFRL